eukprot:6243047-Amphidinium_carterae.1
MSDRYEMHCLLAGCHSSNVYPMSTSLISCPQYIQNLSIATSGSQQAVVILAGGCSRCDLRH